MKRRLLTVFLIIFAVYFLSYLWMRQTHIEVWEKDNKAYVIFPENQVYLYYFYRPLTYIDGALTEMKFHIGQHR